MPLTAPALDTRRYQDLLDEALARIPVHTPEWTNFNPSDPGVTLIEVFAFLTENLLYRANQIPERNEAKFLQILGVPLLPGASARGLVAIHNENGPFQVKTLDAGLEVLAGDIPFRIDRGLDVLPVEARVYYKRNIEDPTGELGRHYNLLYASLKEETADARTELTLYETVEFQGGEGRAISLGDETADGCLWLALLARPTDAQTEPNPDKLREDVRKIIAGKTLSLGIVPALASADRELGPTPSAEARSLLQFQIPRLPESGKLPDEPQPREAAYRVLDGRNNVDVLLEPGIVELTLPDAADLRLWDDLDPLESGSGNFPPALDDDKLNDRVATWIRISSPSAQARLLWLGINTVPMTQRDHVAGEVLEDGNGEPDQLRRLAHPPVIPNSVRVFVGDADQRKEWGQIDDLFSAGSEIPVVGPRTPPGAPPPPPRNAAVFVLNPESGEIRFGDGLRGRRPPPGARIRASYDHSRGAAGNVAARAINAAPALPAGFKVANPVRTWGGASAESVGEGKKQITRYLQHRDRLVAAADFEAIALRTPGLDIGRVEVLPAFNPDLAPDAPGNAPGAVTLMLIPRYDSAHPDAPMPDRLFINAVCKHLDPRRLITTELILRGPEYRPVWITCGIEVLVASGSIAEVREMVKRRLLEYLAPLRDTGLPDPDTTLTRPEYADMRKGWPLRKAVSARELVTEASRVPGVRLINGVRLADGNGNERDEITMQGLQLPRVAGIAVQLGDPAAPSTLIGSVPTETGETGAGRKRIVPVPVIPEKC